MARVVIADELARSDGQDSRQMKGWERPVESAGPAHSLIEVFEHLRISPLDGIADAAVIGDPAVPINFPYAASIPLWRAPA
jgi:hypothetical protein